MRTLLFVAVAAAALAGCTHLATSKDYGSGSLDTAVPGIPYALPAVQFDLDIAHSIQSCPVTHQLSLPGGSLAFSDGSLKIATSIESAPDYVAGEQYLADYRSLSSFVKTTGFGLETYPSGILKSLNASAEDHTADLIKDVVSIGLSIAKMSAGAPAGRPNGVDGTMYSQQFENADGGGIKIAWVDTGPAKLSPELIAALRKLRDEAGTFSYLACRSTIGRDKHVLTGKVALLKAAIGKLAASNALVSRLALISASDHANHDDLDKLEKALADQAGQDASVIALLAQVREGKKSLTVVDDQVLRIKDKVVAIAPSDPAAFDRLLIIERGPMVSSERFARWWLGLSAPVKTQFRARFPLVAEAYGVNERDPDSDRLTDPGSIECTGNSVRDCILPVVTIYAALTPTEQPVAAPDPTRLVTASSDRTSPGLFIRSQQKADFRLCVAHKEVFACPSDKLLLLEREITAPQLGQLRFLPFSSRAFESGKLSLALRENGSIEKFEYGITKSMSSGSAAIKDAVDQYSKYRDEKEAKAKEGLQAQRAEQLAKLEHQIALKTKQGALAKLFEPTAENPLAEITAQTVSIQAEVALLNAQLARKTAEAALLGSGGE